MATACKTLVFALICAACAPDTSVPVSVQTPDPVTTADPNRDTAVPSVYCTQSGAINADPNHLYAARLDLVTDWAGHSYETLVVTDLSPVPVTVPVTPQPSLSVAQRSALMYVGATVGVSAAFQGHTFVASLTQAGVSSYSWHVEVTTPGEVLWPLIGGAPICGSE